MIDTTTRPGVSDFLKSGRAYWVGTTVGWVVVAILNILLRSGSGLSWAMTVGFITASAIALVYTHSLSGVIVRNGWTRLSLPGLATRVVAASLLGGVVITAGAFLVEGLLFAGEGVPRQPSVIIAISIYWAVLVLFWCGIWLGFFFYTRARLAEVEQWKLNALLREAELGSLKAQLDPHFMFNSLNSIRGLISEDTGRAREMITRLAAILRYVLRMNQSATVSLDEEMKVVNSYLQLESIRLEERLRYDIEVAAGAGQARIPPLMVQTLVENAIKFGVAPRIDGGQVGIMVIDDNGMLHVKVTNTGELEPDATSGVGLSNAWERLRLLYGERGSLHLREKSPGVVLAELSIPLETES